MSHNHYDKSKDQKPQNTEVTEPKQEDVQKDTEVVPPVVEEPKEVKKEEPKVESSVAKPEPKKEDKKPETLKVQTPPPVKPVTSNKVVVEVAIGIPCKLKPTVTETVNHQKIPGFAYRNTYKVSTILADRIIIKAGLTYTLAVKPEDVTLI